MADRGGGSNTTHALLSPDPETLPMGEVSRTATGEFPGTNMLQGQPAVAPHAPLAAGLNSSLSQRYGPASITQELVAENGLFQPKLKLTQKSPKLTPHTPCSQRIASGSPHKLPFTKVRLAINCREYGEGACTICGPLAGLAWSNGPAKWARNTTHGTYHTLPKKVAPTTICHAPPRA